ncbi:helix-turn-helix transcriptional regulator [Nisaea acidiphila]|uniref:helix-turn-helix transcriptional regulator n=1 Tax=Nisaea acidiphila TaxID=1862145 RepID=UPI0035627452
MQRLITLNQLLEILQVSRSTAYRLMAQKKLPEPVRICGRTLFRASDIDRFIGGDHA